MGGAPRRGRGGRAATQPRSRARPVILKGGLLMAEPRLGAPERILRRLDAALEERRPRLQKYEDYDAGKHKLAFATTRFRKAFGNLFSAFADNWCPLVIDAAN